ncbi:MAG: HAMP domain-containing sensor histidine kinase [Bryobacteraceae bacterium]
MRRWPSKDALSLGLMCTVLLLLPVLGVLQYRWVGQVSQAERERMQTNLLKITTRFAEDFDHEVGHELANSSISFQRGMEVEPDHMDEEFMRQYRKWHRTTQYPKMFRRGCLAEMPKAQGEPTLSCFDPKTGEFERTDWPAEFASVRERLASFAAGRVGARTPAAEESPIITAPLFPPPTGGRMFGEPGQPRGFPRITHWSITELNVNFLAGEFLPAMIQRHFGHSDGLDYDVNVVSRADPRIVLYRSDPKRVLATPLKGDAVVAIFDPRSERFARFGQGPPRGPGAERGRWQLVVNRRAGSMEKVVGEARIRNLAIGFVVLLLLGASILMIIISTRRAQRLLQAQMEFVAGISHEFRTPLAVICSAGANLADGVVTSDLKAQQYGDVIRKEGRRLSELVEQVLGFSGAQSGWTHYDLQPVDVHEVVERSVAACQSALSEAHCKVESVVQPGLPQIMADTGALERCIKNLIGNATKYAHESGWIGVFADRGENENGPYLRIRVEDKGPGIKEADLPHIFEPFYRSRDAVEARVHGAGLGLSLVKKIIEQHSGRVKVSGVPGGGTCFALYVPIVTETVGAN